MNRDKDWFELWLDKYPDAPSLVLIRSAESRFFPREFLRKPILDLCCGDGFFTRSLGLSEVSGCDIDEQAVKQARKRTETYSAVFLDDARDLAAFTQSDFNTVFSNCGLEHVDGIDRALSSIARVLKPGGRLLMTVPDENLNAWFFPAAGMTALGFRGYGKRLCEEYNQKQQHRNIHSSGAWKEKLERHGLMLEKSFSIFGPREYKVITFFEALVLERAPARFLRAALRLIRRLVPVAIRKRIWRTILKPIYLDAGHRESGGELFIVARKEQPGK